MAAQQPIVACAVLVLSALVAGCSGSPIVGLPEGHALRVDGPEQRVTVGVVRAEVGDYYRFAFPVLRNGTSRSVVLQSAELTLPGPAVQVVGYSAYSVLDAGGGIYSAFDEGHPGAYDPATLPDYVVRGIAIAPGERSPYVVMVRVKLVRKDGARMSGCRFTYRVGSAVYLQKFRCRFGIGKPQDA